MVSDGQIAANRKVLAGFMALLVLVAATSAAAALGFLDGVVSVWVWYARLIWPIGVLASGLGIVRIARMLASGVLAVVDSERIVLRFEIFRLFDRVIDRHGVESARTLSTKYGSVVALEMRGGGAVRIPTWLVAQSEDVQGTLAKQWPSLPWTSSRAD